MGFFFLFYGLFYDFNLSEHDSKPQEISEFVCDLTSYIVAGRVIGLKLYSNFTELNDANN